MRAWTLHHPWEEHELPIEGELEMEQLIRYRYKEAFYAIPQYFATTIDRDSLWTGKILAKNY